MFNVSSSVDVDYQTLITNDVFYTEDLLLSRLRFAI